MEDLVRFYIKEGADRMITERTERDLLGQRLPWWQGVAYRRPELRSTILAPMPLNWLIGWVRSVYFRLLQGPRDHIFEQVDELLGKEYIAGIQEGERRQTKALAGEYERGWDAACRKWTEIFEERLGPL